MPHHLFRIPSTDLNRRELEVCGLLGDGKTTTEIARLLRITEATTRQYIMRAVEKVGVADRHQLTQWVRTQRKAGVARREELRASTMGVVR